MCYADWWKTKVILVMDPGGMIVNHSQDVTILRSWWTPDDPTNVNFNTMSTYFYSYKLLHTRERIVTESKSFRYHC